nr:unnamed protein product [Callosobruchus analis]
MVGKFSFYLNFLSVFHYELH